MQIGEVTPPTAGNADLLADSPGVIDNADSPPPLTGFNSAHHPGSARTDYYDV